MTFKNSSFRATQGLVGLRFGVAFLACLAASSAALAAMTLDLPGQPRLAAEKIQRLGSYDLPLARYRDGLLPARRIEGPMVQSVWQLATPGVETLEILAPLRAQVQQAGFEILFECQTVECGGFDFRFNIPVLPEPEMHVDLGDYRFLSAMKGDEAISLLVSRSTAAGFVQLTQVGAGATAQSDAPAQSAVTENPPPQPNLPAPQLPVLGLAQELETAGSVALDDLVFNSGSASLAASDYASLRDIAAWLKANPAQKVALVGHTDASGGLETNVSLSRKRADAVRQVLIGQYGIPTAQISAEGVGYLAPRASNQSEAGREKNRRVEVLRTSAPASP